MNKRTMVKNKVDLEQYHAKVRKLQFEFSLFTTCKFWKRPVSQVESPGLGSATLDGEIGLRLGCTCARTGGGEGCLIFSWENSSSKPAWDTDVGSFTGEDHRPSSSESTDCISPFTFVYPSNDVVLEPYEPFWFKIAGTKLQKNVTTTASDHK